MSMNKPAYQAIQQHSPSKPSLIFVSSRRQTRMTALDLIAYLAGEDNPKMWLHMDEHEMERVASTIKDQNLKLTLAFGIGMHHAGLVERDRKTVEELYLNQKIQVKSNCPQIFQIFFFSIYSNSLILFSDLSILRYNFNIFGLNFLISLISAFLLSSERNLRFVRPLSFRSLMTFHKGSSGG